LIEIGRACSEIIGQIYPFFTKVQKYANVSPAEFRSLLIIAIFAHDVATFNALLFGILIFQSVSEWQHAKENFSVKNADFETLIGCHGNVP